MTDRLTPEQHYDAGIKELSRSDQQPEPEAATAALKAQAHFQAGLLAAVLEDQEKLQETGWEEKEALREHRAQNPASGASPDGP